MIPPILPDPPVITPDDVRFLRWATEQNRCFANLNTDLRDRTTYLRLAVEPHERSGPFEVERILPVAHVYIESYRDLTECNWLACVNSSATSREGIVGLVCNLLDCRLRANDTLVAFWQIGNDSNNLRDAGLTHDLAFLSVVRGDSDNAFRGQFLVEERIIGTAHTRHGAFASFRRGLDEAKPT